MVSERPKALASVAGRPFLGYLLDQLCAANLRKVVLCTGYRGEQLEQEFGPQYSRVSLRYSREKEPLDTGGALRLAIDHLDDDAVLVLNGDSFCEVNLSALVGWHRWKQADATVVLTHLEDVQRFGSVMWSGGGRICRFEEKGRQGSGWINAGIYILSRDFLKLIPTGARWSLEQEGFPRLARQGRLYGFPGGRSFIDIGIPESYQHAQHFFHPRIEPRNGKSRKRRFVLLDRDGTVNVEKGYLSKPDQLEMVYGAVDALRKLRRLGLGLAVITNQSGLARGYFDRSRLESIHERLRKHLADGGVNLDGVYFCPHSPEDNCACRKPAPGLVYQAADELGFQPEQCFLVGDKLSDIELGKVVGATTFLVCTGYGSQLAPNERAGADYVVADLTEAADMIEKLLEKNEVRNPVPQDWKSPLQKQRDEMNMQERIRRYLLESAAAHQRVAEASADSIAQGAKVIADSLTEGGKLLICGNGGSAAQSQHMAAEFVSTLNKHFARPALAAIALTTDMSILTAISNDFGFAGVFERQVEALGRPGDVLLAISTSGNSENTVRAVEAAKRRQMRTIALVGSAPGKLGQAASLAVTVSDTDTQHIQEVHLAIEHLLCTLIEEEFFGGGNHERILGTKTSFGDRGRRLPWQARAGKIARRRLPKSVCSAQPRIRLD